MKQDQKHDIVLIRHAQSLFNEATLKHANQLGLSHLSWDELIQNEKFNEVVTYNQLYMDPCLSLVGRQQCQRYQNECQRINPDLILVSPYKRALETCQRLFKNKQNVPVIVEPILAQVFRFSCDVPQELDHIMKNFPQFNFENVLNLGDEWYLTNLVPEYHQKIKQKLKHQSKIENRKQLLRLLAKKQVFEYPKMLRSRASRIKKMLHSYKQKYPKIVVVAHNYILEFLKSTGFNETSDLIEYQGILNCHPYYERLQNLLKIQ